ncbi:glycosyltransferase family 9 protein [bacterium]|nr:glycosyltransferase family 9 protein [bacterium]
MAESKYKKILIVRTGAIGDVVHTSALYHAIKKKYPDTIIHYMTSEIIAPLLIEDKNIEKVLTINPKFSLFSKYAKDKLKEIRDENYDLVINMHHSLKFIVFTFLGRIKKQLYYRKIKKIHCVKNFWMLGKRVFPEIEEEKDLKLYLPKKSTEKAREITKDYKHPIFVINAGGVFAKRQGRTYPVDKWIELGKKIQEKYDGTVILNGAEEDKEVLNPLKEIPNCFNFIGKLSLEDSCALIGQADVMISGDSGPLHIATALGVKCIGLYGSMPSHRTGCYSNGINIISKDKCVPCDRRRCMFLKNSKKLYTPCMEHISVDEILEHIKI